MSNGCAIFWLQFSKNRNFSILFRISHLCCCWSKLFKSESVKTQWKANILQLWSHMTAARLRLFRLDWTRNLTQRQPGWLQVLRPFACCEPVLGANRWLFKLRRQTRLGFTRVPVECPVRRMWATVFLKRKHPGSSQLHAQGSALFNLKWTQGTLRTNIRWPWHGL